MDECAAAARSRGFPFFALQGYGECFFGSMADVARVQASQPEPDEACNGLPCPVSAMTCRAYVNKVYFLIGTHILQGLCPQQACGSFRDAADSYTDVLASCLKLAVQAPFTPK